MTKPKDFKIPFTKNTAKITLENKTLFIPPNTDTSSFTFPAWNDTALFGNNHPVYVEFCSGNGEWIIEKAIKNPLINWVAVEIRFDRIRKIWSKIQNNKLSNLSLIFGDARIFSKQFAQNNSISRLYVNFPDPWPKKRHAKHRVINDQLFLDASRILTADGSFIFVTDDSDYSNIFVEHVNRFSHLFTHKAPLTSAPPSDYGTSFFDTLFRSQGKSIHYHEMIKT